MKANVCCAGHFRTWQSSAEDEGMFGKGLQSSIALSSRFLLGSSPVIMHWKGAWSYLWDILFGNSAICVAFMHTPFHYKPVNPFNIFETRCFNLKCAIVYCCLILYDIDTVWIILSLMKLNLQMVLYFLLEKTPLLCFTPWLGL